MAAGEESLMQQSNDEIHWTRTRNLMWIYLAIWFFFGYVVHMFVNPLNNITIPILQFVVMLFVFARQQDAIDRQHGVAEDD
jgi:uncharacterized membrane protein